LELYALHRQALSGDAPPLSTQQSQGWNATERAKYQAWKSKAGLDSAAAMQQYLTEADRQMRVYGTSSQAPPPVESTHQHASPPPPVSRGLAAIPLLCAAASEPRSAYLRRIQSTTYQQAWWRRQEPLTAAPWSVLALPEHALLFLATAVETLSLWLAHDRLPGPIAAALQSYLWPLHNTLLALWLCGILVHTILRTALQAAATLLLGSRRTGHALTSLWPDGMVYPALTVLPTLLEGHQPLSVRLVGLLLLPYAWGVRALRPLATGESASSVLLPCSLYCVLVACTALYWLWVVPGVGTFVMGGLSITVVGYCCAIMELASHM
jgi:acyl-CoA-binding protein